MLNSNVYRLVDKDSNLCLCVLTENQVQKTAVTLQTGTCYLGQPEKDLWTDHSKVDNS